jgi:NAD(P)-dependent dehydrogenase (short-subunit alcohol dehydrogenase family)
MIDNPNVLKRSVLITGAAGGIGRATVQTFAEAGWYVIGVDRNPFGESFPQENHFIQSEITDPENTRQLFDQVRSFLDAKNLAGLTALVNNAAIQIAKPLIETSIEEWEAVITNNLTSAFLGAKIAHPLLKAAGGSAIVNVSSVHAIQTSANIASYAASKGGLLALTRAMAIEFAGDNIRVNAILPGAVDTAMLRASLSRGSLSGSSVIDRLENLARKTVNGRIGQPREIARAIYFLADENQSSFMTGQALVIDGGATARLSTE